MSDIPTLILIALLSIALVVVLGWMLGLIKIDVRISRGSEQDD